MTLRNTYIPIYLLVLVCSIGEVYNQEIYIEKSHVFIISPYPAWGRGYIL